MLRGRGGFLVKCSLLLETLTRAHTNTMSPIGNWVGEAWTYKTMRRLLDERQNAL